MCCAALVLGGGRTGLSECIFYVLLAAPLLAAPESKETASVIKERKKKRAQLCEGDSPPCCVLQFMGSA